MTGKGLIELNHFIALEAAGILNIHIYGKWAAGFQYLCRQFEVAVLEV
jgi:hypothetical protein